MRKPFSRAWLKPFSRAQLVLALLGESICSTRESCWVAPFLAMPQLLDHLARLPKGQREVSRLSSAKASTTRRATQATLKTFRPTLLGRMAARGVKPKAMANQTSEVCRARHKTLPSGTISSNKAVQCLQISPPRKSCLPMKRPSSCMQEASVASLQLPRVNELAAAKRVASICKVSSRSSSQEATSCGKAEPGSLPSTPVKPI